MKLTIVGTGYQGLVVGTCMAENGHQVTCLDRDETLIAHLNEGRMPIHEPGLEELVMRNMEEERLRFQVDLAEAVRDSMMVFICVGTQVDASGAVDLAEVEAAADQIADAMDGYRLIVLKSTCPPGTADQLIERIAARTEHPFDMVVNPDFMKEGAAIQDFMGPDRVVVGCDDIRVNEIMKELYSPFLRTGKPYLQMDRHSAEMVKYAVNVLLASRISIMNQMAELCSSYEADVSAVREGIAADERIGPHYLFPGLGFGGTGIPKDLATCIRMAQDKGLSHDLFEAVLEVNKRRQRHFLERILRYYGDAIVEKRIAVWGAAFKPRTDDIRGAPALAIIQGLLDAGAEVVVYDPACNRKIKEHFGDAVSVAPRYYHALEGADGLVIATEWNEFRRPDYARMASLMRESVIFDGRNLYTLDVMREHGFRYFSVGRPTAGGES